MQSMGRRIEKSEVLIVNEWEEKGECGEAIGNSIERCAQAQVRRSLAYAALNECRSWSDWLQCDL